MKIDVNSLRQDVQKLERAASFGLKALERIQSQLLDDEDPSAALARARRAAEALDEDQDEIDTRRAIRALHSRAGPPGSRRWGLEVEIETLSALAGVALSALYTVIDELEADAESHWATVAVADAITLLTNELGERAAERRARRVARQLQARPVAGPVTGRDRNTRGVA